MAEASIRRDMNAYPRWQQALLSALLLALLITAWAALAPIQLGGQAAYVVIDGESMAPNFHFGDLVIVRQALTYERGDIVAYKNAEIKRFVFHRIIGAKDDRFVLKGDNNEWIDSYQPVQNELVGKFWARIPSAGKFVLWARRPINMGGMIGIISGLVMAGLLIKRQDGKSMRQKSIKGWFRKIREEGLRRFLSGIGRSAPSRSITIRSEMGPPEEPASSPDRMRGYKRRAGMMEGLFFLLGFIAFASLILGYFAFTRPAWRVVLDDLNYQQIGNFFYSASAPVGIYDSNSANSGDPLFPKLTCSVDMGFSYALAGIETEKVTGTYQLLARISDDQSGWQRTIALTRPGTFDRGTFTIRAPLNLCEIETLVANVEQETDLRVPSYTLAIVPTVKVSGETAGRELQDTFEPRLVFRFDKVHFFVVNDDPQINPLNPTKPGVLKLPRAEANTLSILGRELEVPAIRALSVAWLIVSLSGMAVLGIFVSSLAKRSFESFAEIKYGPLLVNVREKGLEPPAQTIDVDTIDDLAKLAERNSAMILHQKRNRIHFYTVRGEKFTYRYTIGEGDNALSPISLVQLQDDLQRGLERGEFEVYYQPIMSLTDGKIFGVEALLRWRHPQLGLVPAAEFIPAAEATGLIDPLGDWLLRVSSAQIRDWREEGLPLTLSINLSEYQLQGDPTASISRALQNTGMDPRALQIEIPDLRTMQRSQNVIPKLQGLKKLGVQISVDNAAGQSVLSSLPQFPITGIKIDRPSVGQIKDQEKAILIQEMIEAARSLGLNVIAEGVETQEQLEFLRSQYCNLAQGYLLGRPVSAQEISHSFLKGRSAQSPKRRRSQ